MNFPTASSGVSLYNVTYFRLKRRGISAGDEAVSKVRYLSHFDQREKSILLIINSIDFSHKLEMTLGRPFETASSVPLWLQASPSASVTD